MSVYVDGDVIQLPRGAVRFPLELRLPSGLIPDDPSTWPAVQGRLEYVGGRLLYMPPCGDTQQDVAVDVVYILRSWSNGHEGFVVGGNEAGMILDGEIRGADAAVWRAGDLQPHTGRFRRVPPVLAVEVAGRDEGETELREKAGWYLERGVHLIWLVIPEGREVLVLDAAGESRRGSGERLPPNPELPGLEPEVDRFFAQLRDT